MKGRVLLLVAVSALALVAFTFVLRQISFITIGLAANRATERILRQSLEDQKRLSRLDADHRDDYRRRFEETRTHLKRLEIVALSGSELTRHFELLLLGTVAAILLIGGAVYLVEQRNREQRIEQLAVAIEALSRGETDVSAGPNRRDLLGRVARIVEHVSRDVARDRKRVQSLEHLSSWQEAARRHAHEIATPLTAAQLELSRLMRVIETRAPELRGDTATAETSIRGELEQLRQFTQHFVSFARTGAPQRRTHDLSQLVGDFHATFAGHWPNLTLVFTPSLDACVVDVDREMIRRVLVNLCTNSSLAMGDARGTVRLAVSCTASLAAIDVSDDGPGIAAEVRGRLFEPYVTTRGIGEGMGLGLAISKKILLDHGGDLELVRSERGAAFRLTIPRPLESR